MTYPPQQPGWQEPSWPSGQQPYADPAQASPAGYGAYPGQPAYGYGTPAMMAPTPGTNGMAIASLICSLAGLMTCGITSVIGAILGHIARKQIRERGEDGDGLALAGMISGWIITGLYVLIGLFYVVIIVGLFAVAANTDPTPYST